MTLTDLATCKARPGPTPYKIADSHGLFLLVQPAGGKLWRLKFRFDGREKKLAIGTYPEIGLGEAHRRRDEAREAMAAGKDPVREKQRDKVRAKLMPKTPLPPSPPNSARSVREGWSAGLGTRDRQALRISPVDSFRLDRTYDDCRHRAR